MSEREKIKLSHTAKRILLVLRRRWRFSNGGNCWKSFTKLAQEINRPVYDTQKAVYELRDWGIVRYSVAVDEDMQPHGSGYFLTPKWDRI